MALRIIWIDHLCCTRVQERLIFDSQWGRHYLRMRPLSKNMTIEEKNDQLGDESVEQVCVVIPLMSSSYGLPSH